MQSSFIFFRKTDRFLLEQGHTQEQVVKKNGYFIFEEETIVYKFSKNKIRFGSPEYLVCGILVNVPTVFSHLPSSGWYNFA